MPKVSVIIPNYNHALYLKQRIDSVLNQTYKDFEVIILDDCSKDNSRDIIETYSRNEKISHIVYNKKNSGSTFIQWEKGIQLAKGEFIWIAESDDWCEVDLLNTIVSGLEKRSDIAFGYCQCFCVNNQNDIIFQSTYSKLEDYYSKNNYFEDFLVYSNAVPNASMSIFRKKFYYEITDYYKSFKFIGDWIFWAELSKLGDVYINARPLNYFRQHNNDIKSKMYASGENFIEEIKMINYFHTYFNLNKERYFFAKVKLYYRYFSRRKNIDKEQKKEITEIFFGKTSSLGKYFFLIGFYLYRIKNSFLKQT